jgi:PAS domain S-box-containing protein
VKSFLAVESRARAYAVACAAVLVATIVRGALTPVWGDALPFVTFYPAAMLAAWYGGLGPGIAAIALSVPVAMLLWVPPAARWDAGHAVAVAVFAAGNLALAALADAHHRARRVLDDFFENAAVGMQWVGADGKIVRANKAELALLGYDAAEYVGRHLADFHVDQAGIADLLARSGRGERVRDHPARLRAKDGSLREVLIDANALWRAGRFVHTRCFTRDVTGARQMTADREALLARAETARAEAEAAERRAAFLSDASALLGSSLGYEATLTQLTQLAVPSVADWCTVDVLEPDGTVRRLALAHADPAKADIARAAAAYPSDPDGRHPRTRVLRTGRPILVPEVTDAGLVDVAGSAEHLAGLRALAYRSAMIVPLVARGQTLGALTLATADSGRRYGVADLRLAEELARRAGLAIDNARLYERERAARAAADCAAERAAFLAEASALLNSTLDDADALEAVARLAVARLADVCVIDVIESDGALRRTGASRLSGDGAAVADELLARTAMPDDPGHPLCRVFQTGRALLVSDAGTPGTSAGPGPHDGVVRALGVRSYLLVPFTARGHALGVIGLASQQPDRYGAEELALVESLARRTALAVENARLYREAQEANRLKDEFLAAVSHELRTPLAAMMNWIHVLRQGKLAPERVTRALDVLKRSGEAQAKLIDDILDVSRAVTGRLRLEVRPVDLLRVVAEALESARPAAEAKQIALEPALDRGVGLVAGDAQRLQQVVWNLLANAVKFTPAGGRITVRLQRVGDEAHVVVDDTGVGIAPGFLPYVFERFRQATRGAGRQGGLGLGLAIVKHLVEAHGGRVLATSDGPGHGARFTIALPVLPGVTSLHQARASGHDRRRPS